MKKLIYYIGIVSMLTLFVTACKEDSYQIPEAESGLHNDVIKRSMGPNVVGTNIEFAYAMALLPTEGKIVSATVEATIAGASGTYLDNKSYYTNNSGIDVGVQIGDPSVTTGTATTVNFSRDTSAATLRYYYKIPEEARGKTVSFKFSAKASNGQTVTYNLGPYDIRKMDMKLDLVAKDAQACYISIADMAVYDAAYAAQNPDKIDLVYLYRIIPNIDFKHAVVAPSANAIYLPGITLPAGVKNNTKLIKAWTVRDQQLARLQYGVFVDDLDLIQKDFTDAPDFAVNVRNEGGLWVETADKKYRAYVYINSSTDATKELKISMKRLSMN
ncbi:DUF4466 family protein [Sphingobacterium spiritivorum]|uniref:DUF4466 family protein n=1 Tax=Sphingobacterium spiritivorum TaxID=258 RepID=UPI001917F66A|nr:DUF4466 family protein [Sphingobacterium spiritivorum]QQT26181.1 DUF4466 family protein [Sphingobacterium spiritivorum]